ncbi:MAG: carbohydrate kinase family protein [Candidatus Magasanikbacteria bacterium]|nr:carbohydrate kinase family protein [Candidatus Magasanikbacteria bacterium]
MFDVLGIGDPIIDTHVQIGDKTNEVELKEIAGRKQLCLEYGAKISIADSFQTLGGNAANTTVALSRLGLKTAFISTVGDDSNGQLVIDLFKKFKVDTSLITKEAGADTRYSIVLNYKAERTILSYAEKKNYIWPEPIPECSWIFYSGLSEGFENIQKNLLAFLDTHKSVRLAVNPGSYMLKNAREDLREAARHADILIVNLEEAEKISGQSLAAAKSEKALIEALLLLGAKEVILTNGPRGAFAGSKEEVWQIGSYPVKVVSKTGAGDAFSAGYLAARLARHDLPHALEWGTANSTGVISAHGPHAGLLLNQTEIEKMIERFPTVKPEKLN